MGTRKSRRYNFTDSRPDISELFSHYDRLYFSKSLKPCTTIEWTSRRNAGFGICDYRDGSCKIQLSEPKLKCETEAEMKDVLLHHMIHAFLLSTDKDHNDHGVAFTGKMEEINSSDLPDNERPERGYHVSVMLSLNEAPHWKCRECGQTMQGVECILGESCPQLQCRWHIHNSRCEGKFERQSCTCIRYQPTIKDNDQDSKATNLKRPKPDEPEEVQQGKAKEPRIETFFQKQKAPEVAPVSKRAPEAVPVTKRAPEVVPVTKRAAEVVPATKRAGEVVPVTKRPNQKRQGESSTLAPTIIGWKGWWALERDEDDVVNLIDRRREKRLEEIARQNVMQLAEECEKVEVGAVSLDDGNFQDPNWPETALVVVTKDEDKFMQASYNQHGENSSLVEDRIENRQVMNEIEMQFMNEIIESKDEVEIPPEDKQLVVVEDRQLVVLETEEKQVIDLVERPLKLKTFSRRGRDRRKQNMETKVESSAAAARVPVHATTCPVCGESFGLDPSNPTDNASFNTHVDTCLSKGCFDY